ARRGGRGRRTAAGAACSGRRPRSAARHDSRLVTTATPTAAYLERPLHVMGTTGRLVVAHGGAPAEAAAALGAAQRLIADLAARLTRFDPASDLERLNDDPRHAVPVGPALAGALAAAVRAHRASGGLVDAGLGAALRDAGYDRTHAALPAPPPPLPGPCRPAAPGTLGLARVRVDLARCVVHRPPGLRVDLGGIAKGLAADRAAAIVAPFPRALVDLGGDLRATGTAAAQLPQEVRVAHPLRRDRPAALLVLADGAAATSCTVARAWCDRRGRRTHHLLDPSTGGCARTGLVQVTAVAATALDAERLAKQALLLGPAAGSALLRAHDGGVLVREGGGVEEVPAR
ncbi:MAG TPA: FAD:protein FMN transferase, partial [Baekduia sp.]|nr:FAD:protein FMN transferase [Baekduia sp.]